MKIRNAWNIAALPNMYIIENDDGGLAMFFIIPFREITEKDLQVYKGHHPRQVKGLPMPDYLYRFYGLEKAEESVYSQKIIARVTPSQLAKVKTAGPPSEVVRKLIDNMDS